MASYLTQQQLTDAWSPETMRQLFDDTNTNTLSASAIALVITFASAQVSSWLPDTYSQVLPFPNAQTALIPEMIQACALEYARYYAYPRNPDYFRAIGYDDPNQIWKRAEALGQQIQSAVKRLIDVAPPPPENVGGDAEPDAINGTVRQQPFFFVKGLGDF